MAFVSAQQTRILFGSYNFTVVTAQAAGDAPTDMLDVTVLNDGAKAFIPGQDTSTFSLSGWMDTTGAADGHLDQMNDMKGLTSVVPVSYAPRGFALGNEAWMAGAFEANFSTGSQVSDKVVYSLGLQTSGPTEKGFSLHDLTAVTVDGDGTGVDMTTGSTTAGAVANLHVTAFSGFSAAVITVADSADNVSFATIGTFTSIASIFSQRLEIAGTIRRYVRYSIDVTGTGSISFVVGFFRR